MWLVGEQSEQCPGADWVALRQCQRAADQSGREETVLTDDGVGNDRGKSGGKKITDAIADDGADRSEVGQERTEDPQDECDRIGQQRQKGGHEQKCRGIWPTQIAVERMTEHALLDELKSGPVISCCGTPHERQFARGPCGDEVVSARGVCRRCQILDIGGAQQDDVRDDQRKASEFHRSRQLGADAARRTHLIGGHRRRALFHSRRS